MSAISLINSGVAWFTAAAVLAFLFSFHKSLSGWIAGVGGAVGFGLAWRWAACVRQPLVLPF